MKLLIRGKRKGREIAKNLIDQHCHCLLKYLNKQDFKKRCSFFVVEVDVFVDIGNAFDRYRKLFRLLKRH